MSRILTKLVVFLGIFLASTTDSFAQPQWQLQGHQERGGGGRDATLRCDGIKLEATVTITRVDCSSAGFWITDGQGDVRRYNNPQDAVGMTLGPGTYWAYPNLLPDKRTATVTLFLSPGGTGPGGTTIGGSSWSVGVLEGETRHPPHQVPWVFHRNGTVEAPGLWTGTWSGKDGQLQVHIVHQGVTDALLVKLGKDGKSFTAFKNGRPYRYGESRGSVDSPAGSTAPPDQPRVALTGDWALKADQYSAELQIRGTGGRILFHAVGRWEVIDQVRYDPSTGQLSFRRAEYEQVYRGRLVTPDRLEGTYIRRAGEGYDGQWSADRM